MEIADNYHKKGYHYTIFGKFEKMLINGGLKPSSDFPLEFFPKSRPSYTLPTILENGDNQLSLQEKLGIKGLLPNTLKYTLKAKQFLGMPNDDYFKVSHCLLETRPRYMDNHPRFDNLWGKLFSDVIGVDSMDPTIDGIYALDSHRVALLSFEIKPQDGAYVSDHSLVINMGPDILHNYDLTEDEKVDGVKNQLRAFSDSLVPLSQYGRGYSLPVLEVKGVIPPERLNVEWVKRPWEVKDEYEANFWCPRP